jgi:DUF438 domain-containing protein
MSEHIDDPAKRQEVLKRLIRELHEGKSVDDVKEEFAQLLQDVGVSEIGAMEQALISEGLSEMEVKRLCDVHVAVFRDSLDSQEKQETLSGHPVDTFKAENAAAAPVLDALLEALAALKAKPGADQLEQARRRLQDLREYEKHYLRKENILFPYLEKHNFSGPSTVMWAIHDDVRADWKVLDEILASGIGDDPTEFNARLDVVAERLSTTIREMFYKEENILFPTALQKLSEEEWQEVRAQESEIGYSYVGPGDDWHPAILVEELAETPPAPAQLVDREGLLDLDTGAITGQEVNLLFKHLPLDISFVGQDDSVKFFSGGQDRVFPRTPAIIGRKVQNCHPPGSVHKVQQILDDFRSGRRNTAEFWIQMKGKFIHISYFAVRDEEGAYQGTLEIVQDATQIRALEGERRLLDKVD